MPPVNPSTVGLHADVPEAALDREWRALVRQHARTLAGMLQRFQTAVPGVHQRTDALWLQALVADAVRLLAVQAQQHVSLERELVQLRALLTDLSAQPAAMTERVQRLEQVLEFA